MAAPGGTMSHFSGKRVNQDLTWTNGEQKPQASHDEARNTRKYSKSNSSATFPSPCQVPTLTGERRGAIDEDAVVGL